MYYFNYSMNHEKLWTATLGTPVEPEALQGIQRYQDPADARASEQQHKEQMNHKFILLTQ